MLFILLLAQVESFCTTPIPQKLGQYGKMQ